MPETLDIYHHLGSKMTTFRRLDLLRVSVETGKGEVVFWSASYRELFSVKLAARTLWAF